MSLEALDIRTPLSELNSEFHAELLRIADWWLTYAQDHERGGFYGEVGIDNAPNASADKGVVLNTRVLWFFSELALAVPQAAYREAADRAYQYLLDYFLDPEHGGVYWLLDCEGHPKDTKKQIYAQAFAIYALVSYHQLSGDARALQEARKAFSLLEQYGLDRKKGGYLEAFTRGWESMDDVRLSDKDLNCPKSMNTHLHVLEAYSTLYKVDASTEVADALRYAIDCFDRQIINKDNFHLRMFMDYDWRDHSPSYTYGHDIETSWLLAKAVESLNEPGVTQRLMPSILGIADVCLREAMGEHGEMYDGYEFHDQSVNRDRVWWVQAEAMVGFYKAYCLCGEERYAQAAAGLWQFIKDYHLADNGEWLWLSKLDDQSNAPAYKLGPWKGPYHNGRAMLEMQKLVSTH